MSVQRTYGLRYIQVYNIFFFKYIIFAWLILKLYDMSLLTLLILISYMFYLFQGEPPGTTRLLRVKVLNGVNLAKKDIFGAR